MKKPKEAAAEAKAQRDRGLRLEGKRRIVETQLFKRVTQISVPRTVLGIYAGIHHRMHRLEAGQRLKRRGRGKSYRVSDLRVGNIFDRSGYITDVSGR